MSGLLKVCHRSARAKDMMAARASAWADASRPRRLSPLQFVEARPADGRCWPTSLATAAPPVLSYGLVEVRPRRLVRGVVWLLLCGLSWANVSIELLLMKELGLRRGEVIASTIAGGLGALFLLAGLWCLLGQDSAG